MENCLGKYIAGSRLLSVRSNTLLLLEGDVANYIYVIRKGCMRLWHNADGEDITIQFFMENQMVASFESFYCRKPSIFSLETLENCEFYAISREEFDCIIKNEPEILSVMLDYVSGRFFDYEKLFLSRIEKNPEERYKELLTASPDLFDRVPHHYIASYLGITPVSLSRIRNRVKTEDS